MILTKVDEVAFFRTRVIRPLHEVRSFFVFASTFLVILIQNKTFHVIKVEQKGLSDKAKVVIISFVARREIKLKLVSDGSHFMT